MLNTKQRSRRLQEFNVKIYMSHQGISNCKTGDNFVQALDRYVTWHLEWSRSTHRQTGRNDIRFQVCGGRKQAQITVFKRFPFRTVTSFLIYLKVVGMRHKECQLVINKLKICLLTNRVLSDMTFCQMESKDSIKRAGMQLRNAATVRIQTAETFLFVLFCRFLFCFCFCKYEISNQWSAEVALGLIFLFKCNFRYNNLLQIKCMIAQKCWKPSFISKTGRKFVNRAMACFSLPNLLC